MAKPTATRRIASGLVVMATIPAVGWLSFSYHFFVGLAVTLIYGTGAVLIGASSIISGVALGIEHKRRTMAGDPEPIPAARTVARRKSKDRLS